MRAAVGKKKRKYKVVHIHKGGGSKKGNTGLLIALAAAAAAYFLISKSGSSTSTTTTTTTDPGTPSGGGLTSNPNPVLVDNGSGTGTHVIQPTPVQVTPGANLPAVSTVAAGERTVLLRDAADYPDIIAALYKMTSQEILDTYQYFYGWFLQNKTLYRYPDPAHPSQQNMALYDAVQTLRAKYGIFD